MWPLCGMDDVSVHTHLGVKPEIPAEEYMAKRITVAPEIRHSYDDEYAA